MIAVYLLAIAVILYWVRHRTQKETEPEILPTSMILVRLTLLVGVYFLLCYAVNIATWIPLVILAFSLLMSANPDGGFLAFLMLPGLIVGVIIQQFILGFPIQFDLVPSPQPTGNNNSQQHELAQHIGTHAITATPLKPIGDITINDRRLVAVSESGSYIDAGTNILVTGVRNTSLLVREE